jgi:SAM-dependent methyltransferase
MSAASGLPAGIDPNRPCAARIYDRFLGGTHNFAADRAVADRAIELVPELPRVMRANRAFLQRAVRFATAAGITQFLDVGSGIPTEGNVHDVACAAQPDARVVYVDLEPSAVLLAREILGAHPRALAVQGDLRRPDAIFADADLRRLLDLGQPVCLLMVAVLHFIPDGPALTAALRRYHEVLAPGSLLVISHGTSSARPGKLDRVADLYSRTGTPLVLRDRDRIAGLFDGWEPVPPGVVYGPEWRPDPADAPVEDPASYITLVGVAVKR